MVAMYGMSDRVGLASCAQRQPTFLNSPDTQIQRDCSEETAREIDEEVRKLLDQSYDEAKDVLLAHRADLDRLAGELLKNEAMDGETFYKLIGQARPALPAANPGVNGH
jgi:cell division protease FtsH